MRIAEVLPALIETSAVTDTGVVRSLNEDSVAVASCDDPSKKDKGTILVVADGLGGHNAGEVASRLVTTTLPNLYFEGPGKDYLSDLVKAVETCNTLVHDASRTSAELQGMGTTLVAALIVGHYLAFVNVGDSRGYLFRGGDIIHRTKDHSLKDSIGDIPGFKSRNRFSHVLTRAIGPRSRVVIDITTHPIENGDVVLLCSDGLTDCVHDEEIRNAVYSHPRNDAANKLVGLAKERGGEDNISVVLARVNRVSPSDALKAHSSVFDRHIIRQN